MNDHASDIPECGASYGGGGGGGNGGGAWGWTDAELCTCQPVMLVSSDDSFSLVQLATGTHDTPSNELFVMTPLRTPLPRECKRNVTDRLDSLCSYKEKD